MSAPQNYRLALIASTTFFLIAPTAHAAAADAAAAPAGSSVDEVVVTAVKEQYRGDVPLKELPQVLQTIPGTLLTDLNITRLDSALDLVAGVARQNNPWQSGTPSRSAGSPGTKTFRAASSSTGSTKGEALRVHETSPAWSGSTSLRGRPRPLFGRGEPGGTVNIITKKPPVHRTGQRLSFGR